MRVALGQLVSSADPRSNLDLVEDNTRRAAADGAELVIFPEATMCAFGNRLECSPRAGNTVPTAGRR
jgi:predicted amidohydrolase